MTNMLQDGATWLGNRLKESAGRTVTYRRGITVSAAITGTVSAHEYQTIGDEGIEMSVIADDWVFTATDLVIRGTQIVPRDGDLIIETLDGFKNQYQVLPVPGHPSCEWRDSSGVLLIVHTKRVDRD